MSSKTKFSISETATLLGISRQTVYRKLHDGTLSRNSDGTIDFVEILRVFPAETHQYVTPCDTSNCNNVTENVTPCDSVLHEKNPKCDTLDTECDTRHTAAERLIAQLVEENSYLKSNIELLNQEKREIMAMLHAERERTTALLTAALPAPTPPGKKRRWFW